MITWSQNKKYNYLEKKYGRNVTVDFCACVKKNVSSDEWNLFFSSLNPVIGTWVYSKFSASGVTKVKQIRALTKIPY